MSLKTPNNDNALGFAGISALLIATASRDLSAINGAFGFSSAEWTVACYAMGVVLAVLGAFLIRRSLTNPPRSPETGP